MKKFSIALVVCLLPLANLIALEAVNLRVAGSWDIPAGEFVGIQGNVLATRQDTDSSVTIRFYSLADPLTPSLTSQFTYRYHRNSFYPESRNRPSIGLVRSDRLVFSFTEWGHSDNMTIAYQWNFELLGSNGQRYVESGDGVTHPVGYDFIPPSGVFSFDGYALLGGGEFDSRLVNLNTNRVGSMGFICNLRAIDFTNNQLIVADCYPYAELPGVVNFYNFQRPDSIYHTSTFNDRFYGNSLVRNGDILFESVNGDSGNSVRVLDLSDIQNVSVTTQLESNFPTPVSLFGDYLMCNLSSDPQGLAFYDITDPEHPDLVASCTGGPLMPFVLNDGKVASYNYSERRVYILDQIGLSVVGDPPTQPGELSLALFPNPFNSTLSITFEGNRSQNSTVSIFDQSGRLQLERILAPNINSTSWEASGVSAGTYFIQLNSTNRSVVQPVVLVK